MLLERGQLERSVGIHLHRIRSGSSVTSRYESAERRLISAMDERSAIDAFRRGGEERRGHNRLGTMHGLEHPHHLNRVTL